MAEIVPNRIDVAINPLICGDIFLQLSPKERLYAYYLGQATWAGAPIIYDQVSPEASTIIALILEMYHSCDGQWQCLLPSPNDPASQSSLDKLLTYFAFVLYNMGNYYGYGDQKFIPSVPPDFIADLASRSSARATTLFESCAKSVFSLEPSLLGFPSGTRQSGYYESDGPHITKSEIMEIDALLVKRGIGLENTRIRRVSTPDQASFEVLQASTETTELPQSIGNLRSGEDVKLRKGSFAKELATICAYLEKAIEFAANEHQTEMLERYIQYFRTGAIEHFKDAQKVWLRDVNPRVEFVFSFVEQLRDPAGTRAEFQGLVAINSPLSSQALSTFVHQAPKLIRELPWVVGHGDDFGPFESTHFVAPAFVGMHALSYASPVIYTGMNLPNYPEIREKCGFKNIMILNRNSAPNMEHINLEKEAPFIAVDEAFEYIRHAHHAFEVRIAIHELLGHGTGNKLLRQADNDSTFDINAPPIDLTTGKPIHTWYKRHDGVTGVFAGLASTLDECRADAIAFYLLSDKSLLSVFGYDEASELKPDGLIRSSYLAAAVNGLEALLSYDVVGEQWSQAHEQGFFMIMRILLEEAEFLRLDVDKENMKVRIHMDETKIQSHGRTALGKLVTKLHMWRVSANVIAFRDFVKEYSTVDAYWVLIRDIVKKRKPNSWMFMEGNMFLSHDGRDVVYKDYERTPEGIIQSWADRLPQLPV